MVWLQTCCWNSPTFRRFDLSKRFVDLQLLHFPLEVEFTESISLIIQINGAVPGPIPGHVHVLPIALRSQYPNTFSASIKSSKNFPHLKFWDGGIAGFGTVLCLRIPTLVWHSDLRPFAHSKCSFIPTQRQVTNRTYSRVAV